MNSLDDCTEIKPQDTQILLIKTILNPLYFQLDCWGFFIIHQQHPVQESLGMGSSPTAFYTDLYIVSHWAPLLFFFSCHSS